MQTKRKPSSRGYTLVEIMVVVSIIALILMIAIPSLLKSRHYAEAQSCIDNLSHIEAAKQIWGLEHNKKDGDVPQDSDLFGPNGYIKRKPQCPAGGTYDLKPIGQNATCTVPGHTL